MLARVLLFFLAFVPVCRVEDYDADGDIDKADSYDRYNEEIKAPQKITTVMEGLTRLRRWDMDDLRTLSQEEPVVDVKGVLNNILQGDQSGALRGPRNPQEHTDSYFYAENALRDRAEYLPNQEREFQQWLPAVEDSKRTPINEKQENTIESSSEGVTEQHRSFVHQPETSINEKNDIIAEVRKLQPIKEGKVPRRSSIETWGTTEATEATVDPNNYPQESTTYNPSEMQAEVKKLVQHWSPATNADNYPQESTTYNPSEMQAEVKKLVQHWSPATSADNYPQESTTYNPSEMQAEVKKLVQHWSPATNADTDPQISTAYRPSGMQAEVRKLVQQWSVSSKINNYPQESTTYNPSEMQAEVKKLVQHWSPATNADTDPQKSTTYSYRPSGMQAEVRKLVQQWSASSKINEESSPYNSAGMRADVSNLIQHWSPSSSAQDMSSSSRLPHRSHTSKVQHWNPALAKSPIPKMNQQKAGMRTVVKELKPYIPRFKQEHRNLVNFSRLNTSDDVQHHGRRPRPFTIVQKFSSSDDDPQGNSFDSIRIVSRTVDAQYWNSVVADNQEHLAFNSSDEFKANALENIRQGPEEPTTIPAITDAGAPTTAGPAAPATAGPAAPTTAGPAAPTTADAGAPTAAGSGAPTTTDAGGPTTAGSGATPESNTGTTEDRTTTATETATTTTTTTTTERQPIDIDQIMAIISNLTYDYEWNLTEAFNKSVIEHGVPTCPWKGGGKWGPGGIWTATTGSTLPYDFENASIVTKCFVCGLTDEEIPRDAHCADAFAGDFLPLMPIDARSRGRIAGYRKYCRYIDVQNYIENPLEPRAIYGRFTGGCAVRWTDLTGVYTQRTCRARYRPLLGKHFASKRMAKLELALVNVDNGCIISPMATLLPVSRGISLYARFHACVCTGNWCNKAILIKVSTNTVIAFVLYWLLHTWPS